MVTAHIEEPPELLVLTANDNNRLAAGKLAGNVMTGCLKLIETAGVLPVSTEHGAEFEFQHAGICVPRRRDGGRAFERCFCVVEIENSVEGSVHLFRGRV
jgi:hypothetical protein